MKFFSYRWSRSSVKRRSGLPGKITEGQRREKVSTAGLCSAGKAQKNDLCILMICASVHLVSKTLLGVFLGVKTQEGGLFHLLFFHLWKQASLSPAQNNTRQIFRPRCCQIYLNGLLDIEVAVCYSCAKH